jgi:hypothetical protein
MITPIVANVAAVVYVTTVVYIVANVTAIVYVVAVVYVTAVAGVRLLQASLLLMVLILC